jgi:hypothetical protein
MKKKQQHVYDNVTHLTPMRRMLLEQQAKQKRLEEQNKKEENKEEDGNVNTNSRKPRSK